MDGQIIIIRFFINMQSAPLKRGTDRGHYILGPVFDRHIIKLLPRVIVIWSGHEIQGSSL